MSRLSRIVFPPSIDSSTASSRAFSCTSRAIHQPRNPIEVFAPFAAGHLAPHAAVRAARRLHCEIDIVRVGFGDLRQLRFCRGIDGIEKPARMRRTKFAVDEELVARLDAHVVALLRRGRIRPAITEVEPPVLRQNRFVIGREARILIAHR